MKNNTVFDCSLIEMSKIHSNAGNITVVENGGNIPFDVERIYYLYDIPGGESRGGHAHYKLNQYIIAASGAFDVLLCDGLNKKKFTLNTPSMALNIVPGLWRELDNFSSGSICLILASNKFDENDYVRDYNKFLTIKK